MARQSARDGGYDGVPMMENLRNYLSTTLPWDVGPPQYLRLFGTVFVLVFAGSLLLHLLLKDVTRPLQSLGHAASISLAYTVVVGLACTALYAARKAIDRVLVWQVWSASFLVFVAGYYLLPIESMAERIPGSAHNDTVSFVQLLPIWALLTYLFVQPYLTESLKSELAKLRDVNMLLEAGGLNVDLAAEPIRFHSGKTEFVLDAGSIRNIAVDDHYCYVHYRHGDGYAKRDLSMPLRDLSALLPADFVQVHRSHIVNLRHVQLVKRKNRSVRLALAGEFEVPVSRYRLDQVLPKLHQLAVIR